MRVELTLNGERRTLETAAGESLLDTLRDRAGVLSPKDGCQPQGQCGACLVLVDGQPKTSCAMSAERANGKSIVTLEGMPADERELLVSDTVGFIDRLPHALVAAFRATLEEAADADLLLHVIDASHPERERMIAAVMRVLESVGALTVPRFEVYNKIDQMTVDERRALERDDPARFCISAVTGEGVAALVEAVAAAVALDRQRVTVELDPDDPADQERLRWVFRHGRVVAQVTVGRRTRIDADVPRRLVPQLLPKTGKASA